MCVSPIQTRSSERVSYLVSAAARSRGSAKHWLRHLRKVISRDSVGLTPKEVSQLLNSDALGMYQKVSLARAVEAGTPTNAYVVELSERATTPLLDGLLRGGSHA